MFYTHLKRICILLPSGVLQMSVRSSWFIVLYKPYVFLLVFYLVVLFITEIGIMKSPTVITELSISSFNSVSFCFMYFEALLLDAYNHGFLHFFCLLHIFTYT